MKRAMCGVAVIGALMLSSCAGTQQLLASGSGMFLKLGPATLGLGNMQQGWLPLNTLNWAGGQYPQQGYPVATYPQQAYGYPQQTYPQQAYPNQSYDATGQAYGTQTYPQNGAEQAYGAYPQNGTDQAYGAQAYPQQTYPQQTYPQQTYPQQTYPQQAYPQQTYPQQTYPQQTYPQAAQGQTYGAPQQTQPQVAAGQPEAVQPQPAPEVAMAPTEGAAQPYPQGEAAPAYGEQPYGEQAGPPIGPEGAVPSGAGLASLSTNDPAAAAALSEACASGQSVGTVTVRQVQPDGTYKDIQLDGVNLACGSPAAGGEKGGPLKPGEEVLMTFNDAKVVNTGKVKLPQAKRR